MPVVRHVVQNCDIIVLVVDARMPYLSQNAELERMVGDYRKHSVVVFTKIDLVSKADLERLRREYPSSYFVSGSKNIGLKKLKEGLFIIAKKFNQTEPKIGVVGYPNVGKSAMINALAKRAKAKVSNVAGTTRGVQWIRAGGLLVSDTPGVIPFDDTSGKVGMMGAKNPEKMSDPELTAYKLIEHLYQEGHQKSLEKIFGVALPQEPEGALIVIGKKRGFLKKGGVVDEQRTAVQILREWQKGKIHLR